MEIVGASPEIRAVKELIQQVAKTDASVLICGESGTGKELIARNIHAASMRSHEPFIAINSGAIPADLLESELFGHEKGSFTGAAATRQGRFELANNGTIFLDEIGDMPLAMQVKLLRVLQERSFERVGSSKTINTNVRIIAATNHNLEQLMLENKFREDLFYRLNVFPIKLPALRERREDIPLLISHYLTGLRTRMPICSFSDDAMQRLKEYTWSGNIRELTNIVERMCILFPNQVVTATHLPQQVQQITRASQHQDLNQVVLVRPNLLDGKFDLKQHVVDTEIALINNALQNSRGVVAQAAKLLGIRRTTLIEKIKKYQLVKNSQ